LLEFNLCPVAAGEVFPIYSHTVRAWRGKRIDSVLKAVVYNKMREEGIAFVRSSIVEDNEASFRMMSRWNSIPYRRYFYRRILKWRRTRPEFFEPMPELLSQLTGKQPDVFEPVYRGSKSTIVQLC
jgi:hypothetical protein